MASNGIRDRVAIVGMGCIVPAAADLRAFWSNIVNKVDAITEVPARRWHRWTTSPAGFGSLELPEVIAHTGVRAPFAFPDGTVSDLVLTARGWAQRARHVAL